MRSHLTRVGKNLFIVILSVAVRECRVRLSSVSALGRMKPSGAQRSLPHCPERASYCRIHRIPSLWPLATSTTTNLTWDGALRKANLADQFDLFISYATDPDYVVARGLHRFLTTFHQLPTIKRRQIPALTVCLDSGSFLTRRAGRVLSIAETVEAHLARSRQLLVLCSSGAARSKYVADEVNWFLKNRDRADIHLGVTEGKNPMGDPVSVFPSPALEAHLEQDIWYDLRGLRGWRARHWQRVRDAGRERVRLAAEILLAAGKTSGLTAEDLYPDWLEHEQKQLRQRRIRWAIAALAVVAVGVVAAVAILRSNVQGELASLRNRASETARIAVQEPEQAMAKAAEVWRDVQTVSGRAKRLPALSSEVEQARVEAQRSLFEVLATRPGLAGTLTLPLEDSLLGANHDGTRFVVAGTTTSGAHTVGLWTEDSTELRLTGTISWRERVQCLALDAKGGQLVVAGRRYIGLWSITAAGALGPHRVIDLAAGNFSGLSCSSAAISPDGGRVMLGSSEGELFEIRTQSGELAQLNDVQMGGIINDLKFDADGRSLYVAVWRHAPAVLRLDLSSKPLVATPTESDDAPRSLALTLDGEILYAGYESGFVTAYSTVTHKLVWRVRVGEASVVSLCVIADGVVVGNESGELTWLPSSKSKRALPPVRMARTTITSLAAWPARGLVLVAGASEPVRLWRTDEAQSLEQIVQYNTPGGLGLGLSIDGRRLTAFGPEELFSWTRDGERWSGTSPHQIAMPPGWRIAAVSPDGRLLALTAAYAAQNADNRFRLAAVEADVKVLPGFEAKLWRGTFSASGNFLAIASFDRPLRVAIWKTAQPTTNPSILEVAKGGAATAVAFSRDESLIAVSDLDSCLYVWRVADPSSRVSHCDQSVMPGELAFDPSGSRLAVGSLSGRIHIFQISPGSLREERTLDGHRESTTALSFDVSGRWLSSASRDGELRFWETTTWQPVGVTRDPDDSFPREIVAGPGEGRIVVLTQGGRRISVWDLDTDRAAMRADRLSRPLGLDTR